MQKRINLSFISVTGICIILISLVFSFVFYGVLAREVTQSLKNQAEMMKEVLNESENIYEKLSFFTVNLRYTLIGSDGTVLFDSSVKEGSLSNHSDRKEFSEALEGGAGYSKRFSDTIGYESYYVAYRLNNGNVIRLSQSGKSIFGIFSSILPGIILIAVIVIILGTVISRKITKKIIDPVNNIDPSSDSIVLYDELSPFVRTISNYKQQIASQINDIKEKSATISTIIQSIKEGIILLGSHGIVISANKSALELFQADENITGKNILELTRNTEILECVKKALNGEACEMIHEKHNKSFQIFFSPGLTIGSDPGNGIIILFLDITERMAAEKIRREFTANVSHELKTPLSSIYGYAEMINNGMADKDDFARFAGKIKDEAARLISLIEDILMLSKLDENSGALEKQKFDMANAAQEAIKALTEKAKENNISIKTNGENQIIEANYNMIYELIFNLVDNGIKYNKPGGSVMIDLYNENNNAVISVKDTGIGIPAKDLDRVFERFYRVDRSRSRKTGGTGLGLSIVKHIVQVHKWQVTLESTEGEGTKVTVTLTLK